jgi:hypothetical protein
MRNTADVTGGKPIAVSLQSITSGDAVNPLVAFYDIHGRKRFFCSVPDTTQVIIIDLCTNILTKYAEMPLPRGIHSKYLRYSRSYRSQRETSYLSVDNNRSQAYASPFNTFSGALGFSIFCYAAQHAS